MAPAIADVAPLGFWGFASLMWTVGGINVGFLIPDDKFFFPAMLLFGGFGQLLPGLVDIARAEMFGAVVFSAFGIFWMTEALWAWPRVASATYGYDANDISKSIGFYRLCWCIIILGIAIGGSTLSIGHCVLLSFLEICIILLAAASFTNGNSGVLKTAGVFQIITAVIAYYCGFAVFFRNIKLINLPMGWRNKKHTSADDDYNKLSNNA